MTYTLKIGLGVSMKLINFIGWMWYTRSFSVTLWISSFNEESWFGLRVSGEEVYLGSRVDWEGICGEYLPEGLKGGNPRGFFETKSFTSHDGGWFQPLEFFPMPMLQSVGSHLSYQ